MASEYDPEGFETFWKAVMADIEDQSSFKLAESYMPNFKENLKQMAGAFYDAGVLAKKENRA